MALVDPVWYAATYGGMPAERAAADFAASGHHLHRDPCRYFSTAWYLDLYPDVAEAVAAGVTTPALHYVRWGAAERRSPHPAVDAEWMTAEYPDLDPEQFMARLVVEDSGLYPHPVVKEALEPANRDRPLISMDGYGPPWGLPQDPGRSPEFVAAEDYLTRGEPIGLMPSEWFDPVWYRSQYPALAAKGRSPLGHYLVTGAEEGRLALPPLDRQRIRETVRTLAKTVPEVCTMLVDDPYAWPAPRQDQWSPVGLVLGGLVAAFANTGIESVVLVAGFGADGVDKPAEAAARYFGGSLAGQCLLLGTEPPHTLGRGTPPEGAGVCAAWIEDFCDRLPSGVALTQDERTEVVIRLVLALQPQVTLVTDSQSGWYAVRDAGGRLAEVTTLMGFYSSYEPQEGGTRGGFAAETPPSCLDHLRAVILDNLAFAQVLARDLGLGPAMAARLHTVYQPVGFRGAVAAVVKDAAKPPAPPWVIWVHLDSPQGTDLLQHIAAAEPGLLFDVFGVGDSPAAPSPNVRLRGCYGAFESLQAQEYRACLHTSIRGGLPPILVEAAQAGLPIVAGDAGGVGELVSSETGYLIDSPEDVEGYRRALSAILADPGEAARRADNARELVARRHSWDSYEAQMGALLTAVGIHPGGPSG